VKLESPSILTKNSFFPAIGGRGPIPRASLSRLPLLPHSYFIHFLPQTKTHFFQQASRFAQRLFPGASDLLTTVRVYKYLLNNSNLNCNLNPES